MLLHAKALLPRDDSWFADMLLGMPFGTPEAKRLAEVFPEYFLPEGVSQMVPHSMLCRRYIVLSAYGEADPTTAALAGFGLVMEVLPGATLRRYATSYQRRPAGYHGLNTAEPYHVQLHVVPHTHQKGGYLVLYETSDTEADFRVALLSWRRVQRGC